MGPAAAAAAFAAGFAVSAAAFAVAFAAYNCRLPCWRRRLRRLRLCQTSRQILDDVMQSDMRPLIGAEMKLFALLIGCRA